MSLGLPARSTSESGEFAAVVKYDARAGRIARVDRIEKDGQYENVSTEITNGFRAVFDLAAIEVGYIHFSKSTAPEWALVRLGQTLPPRPSKEFKPGFRMNILLPAALGGGKREFASCAQCVVEAIDALHTAYSAAPEAKAGKLPVVSMTGATIVRSGESSNYAPTLVISNWVNRPAELPMKPAANGNGHAVQPPVARPQPQQTPPASEFGEAGDASDIPF